MLSQEFSKMLSAMVPDVVQTRIDLRELGVTLRDFEHVRCVYSIETSDANYTRIVGALSAVPEVARDTIAARVAA